MTTSFDYFVNGLNVKREDSNYCFWIGKIINMNNL